MLKKYWLKSKLVRLATTIIYIIVVSFLANSQAFAAEKPSFVTIVNPVRGEDFWPADNPGPLVTVQGEYQALVRHNLSTTWLLRYDALKNLEIVDFFRQVNTSQELGIFLEVTPSLAQVSGVEYNQGPYWFNANRVFLSGYQMEERKKLIDAVFSRFKEAFGFTPTSVGAWHVDATSAAYMEEKYGITGLLIVADQFSTDTYQVWGGYWGTPYYPSKDNILLPAQTQKGKLPLVVTQWAARDPVNGYGVHSESTFSVQANDYTTYQGLTTDYFEKLVDIYATQGENQFAQVTIGLENTYDWTVYGEEYRRQIEAIAVRVSRGGVKVLTMREFSRWYRDHFPRLSPSQVIRAADPLESEKEAIWYLSPNYRVGILKEEGKVILRDLRVYNERWPEPNLATENPYLDLSLSTPAAIDSVRFPERVQRLTSDVLPEDIISANSPLRLPFASSIFVSLVVAGTFLGVVFLLLRKNKSLAILLALGVLSQSATMVKSGRLYPFGMGFWGPSGHDGIWHVALIESLVRGFPPQHPTFSGVPLVNYHYFFDLLLAIVHKATAIPVFDLYFRVFPVIFALLLGILTYVFVRKWRDDELSAQLAVFFAYFGGSWGYLLSLARGEGFAGESTFWANQAISFLINPPYALSIIILLAGLILLSDYLKKPSGGKLIGLSLLFGVLIQVKAYAGIIALFALLILSVWDWWKNKRFEAAKVFIGAFLVSLVVFLPNNAGASSLLVFSPLWFPRTMIAFSDRVGWLRLANARQAYQATGNWIRWILAEGLALTIFLAGNLGTRILGAGRLVQLIKAPRKLSAEEVFILTVLVSAFGLPLVFIQKGNPWNTIQFLYYGLFFSGILAAVFMGGYLKKKSQSIKVAAIFVLVLLTILTSLGTLRQYLPARPPARVSLEELEALDFLRDQPEGVVLTFPYDPQLRKEFAEPRPLYAYESTAYVSAFSAQKTFLEDEVNLEISAYPWRERREQSLRFFETQDVSWARQFLAENEIVYLYLVGGQGFKFSQEEAGLEKVFENGEARIYAFRDKMNLAYE